MGTRPNLAVRVGKTMPASNNYDFLIIGAGIFGLTSAVELGRRGHRVGVLDPGPIPHPLAASTDISKAIRMEYGSDEDYTEMVERCIPLWESWNLELGEELYHPVGVLVLTRQPMEAEPASFAWQSFQTLSRRGHALDRLNPQEIERRFPAWNAQEYVDGYFNRLGGYVEAGRLIEALARLAKTLGVEIHPDQTVDRLSKQQGRVTGVRTREGSRFRAGQVVLCAGAYTPQLLPELKPYIRASGHPVFHLRPSRPELFEAGRMAVFTADVSATGWYGFPLHPRAGVVKIANHGSGVLVDPAREDRKVSLASRDQLRGMLLRTFPSLVHDPIVFTRLCVYTDTIDEHFWIDRHPELASLTVATGGSGHGFKMAPLLGNWIAATAQGDLEQRPERFAWNERRGGRGGEEEARARE